MHVGMCLEYSLTPRHGSKMAVLKLKTCIGIAVDTAKLTLMLQQKRRAG